MTEIKELNDKLIKFALEYTYLYIFLDLLKFLKLETCIKYLNCTNKRLKWFLMLLIQSLIYYVWKVWRIYAKSFIYDEFICFSFGAEIEISYIADLLGFYDAIHIK